VEFIDCEIIPGSSGYGIDTSSGTNNALVGCYIHDGAYGIKTITGGGKVVFSIFDTLDKGIEANVAAGVAGQLIMNNVFYNCAEGISSTQIYQHSVIYNNQFVDCTEGIDAGGASPQCYPDYNNWYNNGIDIVDGDIEKGANASANDPLFNNAAGGDFSLQLNSPCIGAGFSIRLGIG